MLHLIAALPRRANLRQLFLAAFAIPAKAVFTCPW
jgi:hypothetical protein